MPRNLEILVHNFTRDKVPRKFLQETAKKILGYLDKQQNSLALICVSPLAMRRKNKHWRKRNKTTTILTFCEGDIFLCPKEIQKQALKSKISQRALYQLLLTHGILHLFGYTHNKKADAGKMQKLEQKILSFLSKNKKFV